MYIMRKINISNTTEDVISFIRQTVKSAGFTDVIVAVSGGVDSAVSLSLAVRAMGSDHVHALLLPYKDLHEEAKKHAQLLLKQLDLPKSHIHEVDISPMVESFSSLYSSSLSTTFEINSESRSDLNKIRIGNIAARTRMIILYDFAKKLNVLVCGTENKSEHYLGYFTRFGDEASDMEPLRNLYKTEVWQLAQYLGVPQEIITKAPSANLWPGQTDEGQFGFTYKEADEVLYYFLDKKLSETEIAKKGISQEKIQQVLKWVKQASFKHNVPYLPPEPEVVLHIDIL